MRENKARKKLFLIILILFLCLLILLLLLQKVTEKEKLNDISIDVVDIKEEPKTPEEVMEQYDSKYIQIETEDNSIYATLSKDLYNEDGSSNEEFISQIVKDLGKFYEEEDFYIVDRNRQFVIEANYDEDSGEHNLIINGVTDFYKNTDGDTYIAVEKSEIVKGTNFTVREFVLNKLEVYDGYFSHVEEELGEGIDLENGYKSYINGLIKVRTVGTGSARNIIYSKDYDTFYTTEIHSDMTLKEISEIEPNNDFGSLREGYLGYRQQNFYLFFYPDEVSVYAYAYRENEKFEWALSEYMKDKDLGLFVKRIKDKWQVYDKLEYDEETQSAYILVSTRGVEIDIKNNDPKGITLYSNYYFTNYTKRLAKTGQISFEANTDLVNEVEKERRTNENLDD